MAKLSEKAMLVRLHHRRWTASKARPREAAEIENKARAQAGTATAYIKLMKCDEMDAFDANYRAAQAVWKKFTLPWMDDGARILPSELYWEFGEEMRPFMHKANDLVEKIIQAYPEEKEYARKRLGSLYDPNDYPDPESLRNRFDLRVSMFPVPAAEDWRVDLSSEEVDTIKENIEQEILGAQTAAMRDIAKRLADCVGHIHDRLANNKVFRDSLIDNTRELLELIPKMNLTDDEELEDIRKEAEIRLLKNSAKALREDQVAKKETAKAAEDILRKVNAYAELSQ